MNNIFELRSILQRAKSILIVPANVADEDIVAGALSLFLSLQKLRKQVSIVSSTPVKVALSHLFGINKISKQIAGGSALVISLPYQEGSIDKVTSHVENNRLNLVIEPRGENLNFNPNEVEFTYGTGEYDAVFVIGASQFQDLGNLYNRHKNIFTQKPVINIDNSKNNSGFGKVNFVSNTPVSQIIAQIIKNLRLPIDQDIASNLYTGIMMRYGNATLDSIDPKSLDALSFLASLNAKNLHKNTTGNITPPHDTIKENMKIKTINGQAKPFKTIVSAPVENNSSVNKPVENAPEEWLKPKIFTTNNQSN